MLTPLLITGVCLAAVAPDTTPTPRDLAAYEKMKSEAGRDAEAQVRLALWCEARGLTAERVKHLARAVLADPNHATARGLLGLVSVDGRWRKPEDVARRLAADDPSRALTQEYLTRRAETPLKPDAQWKLARWCEDNGLAEQARAHDSTVVRLDPRRGDAWKKLGYVKAGDGWARPEELAARKQEREAQKQANYHWKPIVERLRDGLTSKDADRRARAEADLAAINEPRAVPAIWEVLMAGDARCQQKGLEVLAQVDGPESSRAIAATAVYSPHAVVRGRAIDTAERRDPRDFLDPLISLIRRPFKYTIQPLNGPGSAGGVFVDGEHFNVQRIYRIDDLDPNRLPRRIFTPDIPFNPFLAGNPAVMAAAMQIPPAAELNTTMAAIRRDLQISQVLANVRDRVATAEQSLADDVRTLEATNASIKELNARVLPLLTAVTGEDRGPNREAWRSWWSDQLGYAYQSPPAEKPTYTQIVNVPMVGGQLSSACFAAETQVHTIEGPRAIETIEIGDRVLSQDAGSGGLSFQPVLAIHHNPPTATLKLRLGEETVVATGIHRFWKAGKGWTMARDLKPGDVVRTLGGTARLESVEPGPVQPVFNLDVAENRDFFVGRQGYLVYDFSIVRPVDRPFDVPASP